MAFKFAVVVQNLPAVGTVQDFTDGQFSGDVKGALAFASGSNGGADDNAMMWMGYYDGTDQLSLCTHADHGETTPDGRRIFHSAQFMHMREYTENRVAYADASTLTNGIRLTFTDSPTSAYTVTMVIFGGDCDCKAIVPIPSGTPDGTITATFTGLTFALNRSVVFSMYARNGQQAGQNDSQVKWNLGAIVYDGSDSQASMGVYEVGPGDASKTWAVYSTHSMSTAEEVGGWAGTFEGSSFTGADLTVTTRDEGNTPLGLGYSPMMAVVLSGEDRVGITQFQAPTAGAAPFTTNYTGLGFDASHVILYGTDQHLADTATQDAAATISVAAWDANDNFGGCAFSMHGGQNPTVTKSYGGNFTLLDEDGTVGHVGEKAGTQASDGFTVNWTTRADAVARRCFAVAFGAAVGAGGTGTEVRGMSSVAKVGTADGAIGYWP